MGRNDPQGAGRQVQIDNQRPARFETRQIELMGTRNAALPVQDHISVPAMAALRKLQRNRYEAAFAPEHIKIKKASAIAETPVRFL